MDGNPTLHIFFFPSLAHGHIIPVVDMAKLFAAKGVKATIVTTPLNVPYISKTDSNSNIHIQTIKFPWEEAGLPEGCENAESVPSQDLSTVFITKAMRLLQQPLEQLLLQQRPDCLVADMFYPWAVISAARFGIPTIVFPGTCFFSTCAGQCLSLYEPHKNVSSDSEHFVIPHLPGEIKMTRMQMIPAMLVNNNQQTEFTRLFEEIKESEAKSYGVIFNSFYELEKDYVDYYRKELGKKAWHVGPVSLCNRDREEKARRGKEASIDKDECLKWLDTKKPNSVVYVCFGSLTNFPDSQLRDIAVGLEASGQQFIWVVRKISKKDGQEGEEWLPDEGFEKRMEGKGLIIRGWAPQVLILEHEAIGAFVTHCGWNSALEAVAAGMPMVTWPISSEQFYNEKLVTEVLKIGVPVGVKRWTDFVGDKIEWDAVEKALKRIMVGEEAEELRNRAKVMALMALRAVDEGGSSQTSLNALIQELSSLSKRSVPQE